MTGARPSPLGPPAGADVVLVSMPFAFLETPSIGLSILREALRADGVLAEIGYATIDFARRVGREAYEAISTQPGMSCLAGDWLFGTELFGTSAAERLAFVDGIRSGALGAAANGGYDVDRFVAQLDAAGRQLDAFLDDWTAWILEREPAVVGFTSVFQQHLASLALARRLKRARPDLFVVLGGPACDDVLGVETARSFRFLDAVVYGEAEEVFPELVRRAREGEPVTELAGVYHARNALGADLSSGTCPSTTPVQDLDAVGSPRYEDFLEQLETHGLRDDVRPELLLETSRGCWWGEKHHCVFCGLNDVTMGYRHKRADRVVDEIEYLRRLAPEARVTGTDAIFNMRYFRDLVPELTRRGAPMNIYFETKANLRDAQVAALYGAGVRTIQPGIESLITPVLRLMDKGVTALQNVYLLRSCEERGVECLWNHLWAVPGEEPGDYAAVAPQVARLVHLQPPEWMGPIAMLRFSPLHTDPERFGISDVRHSPLYDHIYSALSPQARDNLAYYFSFSHDGVRDSATYTAPLAREIDAWRASYYGSTFFWGESVAGVVELWDTRPTAATSHAVLANSERDALLAFEAPRDASRVLEELALAHGMAAAEAALDRLDELGALFWEGSRAVRVAIALGDFEPRSASPQTTFIREEKLRLLRRVQALVDESAGALSGAR